MKKIAMLGGTFNPIHNGHIQMALGFVKALKLDSLLLMPANIPPHKRFVDAVSAGDRLAMCRLAAAGYPALEACDLELRRQGPSYTADTLEQLKELFPGDELYLIMGADMFLTVQDWKRAETIVHSAVLCAAPRDDDSYNKLTEHAQALTRRFGDSVRCQIVDLPLVDISSTQIRARVAQGLPLTGLVPPSVEEYMKSKGLYQKKSG